MNQLPALQSLFASATAAAGSGDGVAISVPTALLVLVAGGLAFCIKAILDLQRRVEELESAPAPAAPRCDPLPAPPPPAAAGETIPPEILAVIATAAHVALKGRVRLVAVTPLSPEQQIWSIEGRRQVFQSHVLR